MHKLCGLLIAFFMLVGGNSFANQVLQLNPQVSTSPAITHAGLVVSTEQYKGGFTFKSTITNVSQNRIGSTPNPWEVGWILWGYQDDNHFYAFAYKTNGWELTKEDPSYLGGQRFLMTGNFPAVQIGATYTVRVDVDGGGGMAIYVNDVLVTTFVDLQAPVYTVGSLGVYTEDATVQFDNLTGPITDNFDTYALQSFPDGATFGPWTSAYNGYGVNSIMIPGSAVTTTHRKHR